MSQINTVLVKDDLLCYSDSIDFAVEVSGQNVSTQKFPSTAATTNSQVYTIQVPSITTVISREILRHETFQLLVSGTPATGGILVNLGTSDCCAPFPLHQLTTNMNLQINNSSVSVQTNEILDPILRCMERKRLSAISNFAPTQLDVAGDYQIYAQNQSTTISAGTVNSVNNPFAGYQYAIDSDNPPRGAFVVQVVGCDATGTPLPDGLQPVGDGNVKYSLVTVSSTEPLFISPLVFGDYDNKAAGFTGINQINLTCNIDATASRAWRYIAGTVPDKAVSLFKYIAGDCYLECRFLTPKPDMVMPATCVSPYAQYNLFKTKYGTMAKGASLSVPSTSIQLNGVPDMAIIFVRQPLSTSKGNRSDCYATITNVSINFNNSTSVCANFTPQMLWKMSKESGSNQSWLEFSGQAVYSRVPNTSGVVQNGDPSWNVLGTTGSIVALKFGEHIQLTDSWTAPSSMGNYNFQVQVGATNNTGLELTDCELCVIMVNSGIFTSQAGQSSLFTNLLSKQQVLDAQTKEPVSGNEIRRLVGSGFLSRVKTLAHHAAKHVVPHLANLAKSHLAKSDSPLARLAEHAIDTGRQVSGYGMSAGNRRLQKHLM